MITADIMQCVRSFNNQCPKRDKYLQCGLLGDNLRTTTQSYYQVVSSAGVEHLVVSAFVSCPPALDITQYLFNPECSFRIAGGSCKDL